MRTPEPDTVDDAAECIVHLRAAADHASKAPDMSYALATIVKALVEAGDGEAWREWSRTGEWP